ncbi:nuclease-related domain-containing protein [Paraliobacillus ryukyuensis]|uniref:nuclease-related domain-containing protein n=1 Tax=Paraliobacillus ryukyuensis TaxID=200904 RepID=UPI0009A7F3B0|nr:nuclease-related domain-containing protein [Paraliobacillus ryukyuensis]
MKKRQKPSELIIYEYLSYRKTLAEKDSLQYRKLKTGYQGEVLFDEYVEQVQQHHFIIRDLWLSYNNKAFQIDLALFINKAIYLYEVKNYTGEFYYANERLYTFANKEIDDPLLQLKRTESLLTQLLNKLGYNIPIHASVVFVNPNCTIFQAPRTKRIILPTQLNRYFGSFPQTSTLDPIFHHLANKLHSIRLEKSPYEQLPIYQYVELQKGIPCLQCRHFYQKVDGKKCVCEKCGNRELVQSAILRNVEEFMILFPNEPITTVKILEWCDIPITLQRIKYTLQPNFEMRGSRKGAYYVKKL